MSFGAGGGSSGGFIPYSVSQVAGGQDKGGSGSTSEAAATPPLLGSEPAARPSRQSTRTTVLDTAKNNANPRAVATYRPERGAPQQAFGSNTLLGQA